MSIWQYSSTEARTQAKQRYNERHYDQLKIWTPKGGRAVIAQLAAASGLSTAEYIRQLVIRDADHKGIDVRDALGGGVNSTSVCADIITKQLCGDWVR